MATSTASRDGDVAAAWAEAAGFAFSLETTADGDARVTFASGPDSHRWAYWGSGSPTRAVHEAMTYAVRDRGFTGAFTERCDFFACPFCTEAPFPTDAPRVTA